jgi:hypothetical protein
LIERLEHNDATDLGLNPDEMTYRTISKIEGSSEKALAQSR